MTALQLEDLTPHARELALTSLRWSEQFYDPNAALLALRSKNGSSVTHSIRNSVWFALGSLLRSGEGDDERACRTIEAVLATQYDEPRTPYHGTFPRWLGEPHPPEEPVMWRDYDPNWRQFIGTTLAIVLDEYAERLPQDLRQRIDRAIQLAVVGEPADRCPPWYTNIALMKAGLLTWAGERYARPDWTQDGETFGRAVVDLFQEQDTFYEYNSPTYYGVNFYALAFWRRYAHSQILAQMGATLETELWRDVAQYYHAGLRNICGPYTRSYGMDMLTYGALLGLSIWLVVGRDLAPFPRAEGHFEHGHDFSYGPCLALVGTAMPDDALPHFQCFQGEREVERRISALPDRVATAWLAENVMMGAEAVQVNAETPRSMLRVGDQYHPATMHWKTPAGDVAWMRLRHAGPVQARAEQELLTIAGSVLTELQADLGVDHRRYAFQIHVPGGIELARIRPDRWDMPGLLVHVESNLTDVEITQTGESVQVTFLLPKPQTEAQFRLTVE